MSDDLFSGPAALPDLDAPVFDRNGVRRSKDGRPYVKGPCPGGCDKGRVEGARGPRSKACPKKCTEGVKETLYTRCTSYVGALEDRQNLEAWQKRVVLLGLAADARRVAEHNDAEDVWNLLPSLLDRIADAGPDDRETLDALAEEAYALGDGYRAAQKGTDLHGLTERVDEGLPLGEGVSIEDRADMAAWVRLLDEYGVRVLDIERFVVVDRLKIGGTYDRTIESDDPRLACPVDCGKPKVLDLKTGRIDYGAGKMSQQLAVYANGRAYDAETGKRSPHRVCRHRGFIAHLPQGTGEATMHALDLVEGWKAVRLSKAVREHRRVSKSWIIPLGKSPLAFSADS